CPGELYGHGRDQRLPLGLWRVDAGVDRYGLYLGGVDAREDIFYDLVRRFTSDHDAIVEQADDVVFGDLQAVHLGRPHRTGHLDRLDLAQRVRHRTGVGFQVGAEVEGEKGRDTLRQAARRHHPDALAA